LAGSIKEIAWIYRKGRRGGDFVGTIRFPVLISPALRSFAPFATLRSTPVLRMH
jgi:hypothetical protein